MSINIWAKISIITMILGVALQGLSGVFWWILQTQFQRLGYQGTPIVMQLSYATKIWGTWALYLGVVMGVVVLITEWRKKKDE